MIITESLKNKNASYYEEALGWHHEKYAGAVRRARMGWIVALVFGLIAILSVTALATLSPLKTTTVEPYIVEVDRVTGETAIKRPLRAGPLSENEVLTKFWLNQYILARETYDHQDLTLNYQKVRLLSGGGVFKVYDKDMDTDNPESPYQRYGKDKRVTVDVKNINLIDANTAMVRIDRLEWRHGDARAVPYVITVSFQFTRSPTTESARLINPLGFQVTQWRMDPEIIVGEK